MEQGLRQEAAPGAGPMAEVEQGGQRQQGEQQQQRQHGEQGEQQQQAGQHSMSGRPEAAQWRAGGRPEEPGEWYSYTVGLQYDGTAYWGWQLQPVQKGRRAKPTIQLRLEEALCRVTGEHRDALRVQAAGRTDSGVHARGQVAQFSCRRPLEERRLLRSLNALLPPDIRATSAARVPLDFHVRYAQAKTYFYDIHLAEVADPFLFRFRHHPLAPGRLQLEAMADAARLFEGRHNFSLFSNLSVDGARKSPVKTISQFQMVPIEDGARFEVTGDGFLYKQVRHMTGALLAVGCGRCGADDIGEALAVGAEVGTAPGAPGISYQRRWTVAEAKGLCLQAVVYYPASALPLQRT